MTFKLSDVDSSEALAPSAVRINKLAEILVLGAVVMTVIEGAFRKWIVSSGSAIGQLMYFSKDILFALILILPVRGPELPSLRIFREYFVLGVSLFTVGAMVSAFDGFNAVGALLTFRACVLLPIVSLLSVRRLYGVSLSRTLFVVALLTLLNAILGFIQSRFPEDHLLNKYSDPEMAVVTLESGQVRAVGTFSYITGMGVMSTIGVWAGLCLMSVSAGRMTVVTSWLSILGGIGCALVSVSRGPMVIAVAMVVACFLSSREGLSALTRGVGIGIAVAAFFVIVGGTPVILQFKNALMERNLSAEDSLGERAFGQVSETIDALRMAPFGAGLGTEQVGGNVSATGQAGFTTFESPLPRLVMETGILGLVGYFVICFGVVAALQQAKRDVSSPQVRVTLTATQFALVTMLYGAVPFVHTASAFAWILLALMLASAFSTFGNETNGGDCT